MTGFSQHRIVVALGVSIAIVGVAMAQGIERSGPMVYESNTTEVATARAAAATEALQTLQPTTTTDAEANATSTRTQALARFMAESITLDGEHTQFATTAVANQASNLARELAAGTEYKAEAITVHNQHHTDALTRYGNELAAIMLAYPPVTEDDEIALVRRVALQNDTAAADTLRELRDIYQNMGRDMRALRVPARYQEEHLALVNALANLATDLDAMAQVKTDPIYGLVRLQRFTDDVETLFTAITTVYRKLYEAGVRFTPNDIAHEFVRFEE